MQYAIETGSSCESFTT